MFKFKHIFVAVFSFLVLFTSCQNEETQLIPKPLATNTANAEKIEQFGLLDLSTKKLAYSSLSSDEKFTFWTNHLTSYLKSTELSEEQKSVVKESLDKLTPEVYQNEAKRVQFKAFMDGQWGKKLLANFTKQQIQEIFLLVDFSKKSKAQVTYLRGSCDCNPSSIFIDDCFRGSCVYAPGGCTPPRGDLGYTCGAMWLDHCNAGCL
jgi:hypothetical protein